jgi:hypothetical protein
MANHSYQAMIPWSREACDYDSYPREYRVAMPGKAILLGPADAALKGDPKLNPEDCFLFHSRRATC